MRPGAQLTLVSRRYCHLCEEMETALKPLLAEFGADVEVLDVDADPELEALYDELVPVLLGAGEELSRYFLDRRKVRDYLSKIG
ncbi:MAG: glutaredoxin family protein [Gammaproteobacteria bacterium]|nr:MAG: glutaredoxin family protein [Gammaproteobacteria bacterium]